MLYRKSFVSTIQEIRHNEEGGLYPPSCTFVIDHNEKDGGMCTLPNALRASTVSREFKIYDAAGSTTRFGNKEICQAKQKL